MFRAFRATHCRGYPQRSRGVSGYSMHDTGFARSIRAVLEKTRLARALMLLVVLLISAPPALAYSCGSSSEGEFIVPANGRLPANAVGVAGYGFKIQPMRISNGVFHRRYGTKKGSAGYKHVTRPSFCTAFWERVYMTA